jgi:hypothetical protein
MFSNQIYFVDYVSTTIIDFFETSSRKFFAKAGMPYSNIPKLGENDTVG